jgi:AraC-like DNA-binding protein
MYEKIYFKDEHVGQSPMFLRPAQFFEIHDKCVWKNGVEPHRLDFYMIFLATGGKGSQRFGLKDHIIEKNALGFVGPNVITSWKSHEREQAGFVCVFSDDFYHAGRDNKQLLPPLPFFQIDGNAVLHLSPDQMTFYESLFRMMASENKNRNNHSDEIFRSFLQALLAKAAVDYGLQSEPNRPELSAGFRLLTAFDSLYREDLSSIRTGKPIMLKKISDYAAQLNVSQNHLNDTIKNITGKSAGQRIHEQLVKQATMCLRHADKSIAEIAYRLGFEDTSYFAKFYKKYTGISPSGFRTNTSKNYQYIRNSY